MPHLGFNEGYSMAEQKSNIVIDIETISDPVTQEEIQEAMAKWEAKQKPIVAPKNFKDPAKIEARLAERNAERDEAREDYRVGLVETLSESKAFKLATTTMISCSLGVADILSGEVQHIKVCASDELSEITNFIVAYLNRFPSGYRLIGFNHEEFDLPIITKSFSLTGVFPRQPVGKWDSIDLLHKYKKQGGLKVVGKAFGFDIPDINGSAVARLYSEGDWDTIRQYNKADVLLTGQLFIATARTRSLY